MNILFYLNEYQFYFYICSCYRVLRPNYVNKCDGTWHSFKKRYQFVNSKIQTWNITVSEIYLKNIYNVIRSQHHNPCFSSVFCIVLYILSCVFHFDNVTISCEIRFCFSHRLLTAVVNIASDRVSGWLIEWVIDWLNDWVIEWVGDWLIDLVMEWLVEWLIQ